MNQPSSVDVHQAATALRLLARRDGEDVAALRPRILGALREIGFVPDAAAPPPGAPPGTLLVCASRRNGTLSVYELPPTIDGALAAAVTAMAGISFARLEDLDAGLRGHAVRLLIATRQTGLAPDELATWVADVGSEDCPELDELEALDNACGEGFRGEASHGGPPVTLPALGAFDRVVTLVYDGD